jgi:hypothetical protein
MLWSAGVAGISGESDAVRAGSGKAVRPAGCAADATAAANARSEEAHAAGSTRPRYAAISVAAVAAISAEGIATKAITAVTSVTTGRAGGAVKNNQATGDAHCCVAAIAAIAAHPCRAKGYPATTARSAVTENDDGREESCPWRVIDHE